MLKIFFHQKRGFLRKNKTSSRVQQILRLFQHFFTKVDPFCWKRYKITILRIFFQIKITVSQSNIQLNHPHIKKLPPKTEKSWSRAHNKNLFTFCDLLCVSSCLFCFVSSSRIGIRLLCKSAKVRLWLKGHGAVILRFVVSLNLISRHFNRPTIGCTLQI